MKIEKQSSVELPIKAIPYNSKYQIKRVYNNKLQLTFYSTTILQNEKTITAQRREMPFCNIAGALAS